MEMKPLKKRNLYLIGAGELGREIESWLSFDKDFLDSWNIIGFLDRNLDALANYPSDYKVIGVPESFDYLPDDAAIMCVASPKIKKRITEVICKKVEIISYISPKAIIAKFTKIGGGVVVCPNAIISTNVILNDYVAVNIGSQIGHDCIIGPYSSIMTNVDLGGHTIIGESVFMGSNSTVIPKIKISDNIFVGAGAIVTRNLRKEGTYSGNPALLLRF